MGGKNSVDPYLRVCGTVVTFEGEGDKDFGIGKESSIISVIMRYTSADKGAGSYWTILVTGYFYKDGYFHELCPMYGVLTVALPGGGHYMQVG